MIDPETTPKTTREAFLRADRLAGTLNSRLTAYRDLTAPLIPAVAEAYDRLVARLNRLDRDEIGPKIGDRFPTFYLPDQLGRLVSLPSLLEAGPLVVAFNRGHWCPYCKLELRSIAAIHDQIRAAGAQVVSIMPDSAQFTRNAAEQSLLPFPVLSDVDLGYSLSLDLIYWIGDEVTRLYQSVGVDLERYQGNGSYFLPMAAKFVLDRHGIVRARQVDIEFRKRMEPEQIIATLQAIR